MTDSETALVEYPQQYNFCYQKHMGTRLGRLSLSMYKRVTGMSPMSIPSLGPK